MTATPPADPRIEAIAARLKEAAQKSAEAYAPPTGWQPIWRQLRKRKSIKAKKAELVKQRQCFKAAGVRRFYGAQTRRLRPPAEPHRQRLCTLVQGINIAVWANTLLSLQRGEPWYEIGVDDPHRRRSRHPEPVGR